MSLMTGRRRHLAWIGLIASAMGCTAASGPEPQETSQSQPAAVVEPQAPPLLGEQLGGRHLLLVHDVLFTGDGTRVLTAWRLRTLASQPGVAAIVAWQRAIPEDHPALTGLGEPSHGELVAVSRRSVPALAVIDDEGHVAGSYELATRTAERSESDVLVVLPGDVPIVGLSMPVDDDVHVNHLRWNIDAGHEAEPSSGLRSTPELPASFDEIARLVQVPEVSRILFSANGAGPRLVPPSVKLDLALGGGHVSGNGEGIQRQVMVFTGFWNKVGWFPAADGEAWTLEARWLLVRVY